MSITAATTTTTESRPSTPTSPVIIPTPSRASHESQRSQARNERPRMPRKTSDKSERRARTVHSPDAIPPSVAALLAITAIPVHKTNSARKRGGSRQRLTVDAILQHTGGMDMEKELSRSLSKSHMDFLLSPPDELEDDEFLVGSDVGMESVLSTRTMSSESMPSLDGDSALSPSPSLRSLVTPGSRGRKSLPKRHILSSSPPGDGDVEDHPLLTPKLDIEELDFRVFEKHTGDEETPIEIQSPVRKSAFKSNLTASLRALASAARLSAKSFSTLTTPMITPDDFLTRSIISIDPRVPFTDERMPPKLEDTPTPALRRYLNPTTNAPIEAHVPSSLAQTTSTTKCTASIQMQTYKVSRSARGSSPSVISRRTQPTSEDAFAEVAVGPVARQRDMRENSDFIRIAVMEMAMRKKGKLDDQKPGRARWALPPRKPSTTPYEIGENGVPVRWMGITY
ncbi:hypothetical protein BP5796_00678 [Coleophoma crateriformis]|uniref:Uncharacterized protein n=1 Tax=Coleophoma crateriformis TaxID=565419 RepID=A0A3D8T8R0_9HELO|nr:hypothetical protein BP5796_00678 [Coleophoma crateriformis]